MKTLDRKLAWGPITLLFLSFACGKDANQPDPGPTEIIIVAGGVQHGTVAQPLDTVLTVRINDQDGDPVAGIEVHFQLSELDGGQVSPTADTTDGNGLARSVWTLGTSAGALRHVQASAVNLNTVVFQATSVAAEAADLVIVSGDSQAALVGTPLDSEVVIRVRDQFGNGVPQEAVVLAVTTGSGHVTPLTAVSDSRVSPGRSGPWDLPRATTPSPRPCPD